MIEGQGTVLGGRYQLQRTLSVTSSMRDVTTTVHGMDFPQAAAWLAFDIELDRKVFVKLFSADTQGDILEAHRHMWQRLRGFRHPGMPALLHFGKDTDRSFVVTEWLDGLSLDEAEHGLRRDPRSIETTIEAILKQGLDTLSALHNFGLVHGDLSPGNIMLSGRRHTVWLVDPAPELPAGQLMTTFAWVAPELKDGAKPSPGSDLYALGKVLAALAARNAVKAPPVVCRMAQDDLWLRPIRADDALAEFLQWERDREYSAPSRWDSDVAEKMMHSEAEDRFESAAEQKRLATERRAQQAAEKTQPAAERPFDSRASAARASGLGGIAAIGAAGAALWGWAAGAFKGGKSASEAKTPARPAASAADSPAAAAGTGGGSPSVPDSSSDWSDRTGFANVPIAQPGGAEPTDADFIVMGPSIVSAGTSFPLELWMGPNTDATGLRERAQERGVFSDIGGRSRITLPTHSIVTASMSLPGFTIDNPIEQIAWDGTIRNTAFIVQSSAGQRAGQHWGTIKLLVDAVPQGMVSFCVVISEETALRPNEQTRLNAPMQRFRTAFASYASQDRAEVFKRVQAIRASRVDVFSDIAQLRGGERWEDALMREIGARDVFYLFWSRKAAASKWVEREWRHAIDTRGVDFICPIPLEDPRVAKPPTELAQLHFNDWCLAIIQNEQAMANGNDHRAQP